MAAVAVCYPDRLVVGACVPDRNLARVKATGQSVYVFGIEFETRCRFRGLERVNRDVLILRIPNVGVMGSTRLIRYVAANEEIPAIGPPDVGARPLRPSGLVHPRCAGRTGPWDGQGSKVLKVVFENVDSVVLQDCMLRGLEKRKKSSFSPYSWSLKSLEPWPDC
jgi:hypothetical protein